jgi:hypothetical protein
MMKYQIKPGHGYWQTDKYPIGGSFARAGDAGLLVEIQREFKGCEYANAEGRTADGQRVAFKLENAEILLGM